MLAIFFFYLLSESALFVYNYQQIILKETAKLITLIDNNLPILLRPNLSVLLQTGSGCQQGGVFHVTSSFGSGWLAGAWCHSGSQWAGSQCCSPWSQQWRWSALFHFQQDRPPSWRPFSERQMGEECEDQIKLILIRILMIRWELNGHRFSPHAPSFKYACSLLHAMLMKYNSETKSMSWPIYFDQIDHLMVDHLVLYIPTLHTR